MLEAEGIILIPAGGSPLPAEKSYMNRRVDDRGITIFVVSGFAKPLFLYGLEMATTRDLLFL